jgi:hypothetical protein
MVARLTALQRGSATAQQAALLVEIVRRYGRATNMKRPWPLGRRAPPLPVLPERGGGHLPRPPGPALPPWARP